MKLACIGGGPAGLFLALLMRRAGDHQVEVFERNAAHATFGFGVVFSRLSLARLRSVAPDVVSDLLACGAQWDDLEIRRGGASVRSGGHGFAAVERRAMLAVLQRHAVAAGVTLRFETEVQAESLTADFDLVVACDGANSRSMTALAGRPAAQLSPESSRYAWFAADRVFEKMTFLFADSEYGPVAAHAYPYSADRSTFLVEMDAVSWRRAGFTDGSAQPADWTDPAAHDFVARVFADELGSAKLHGNGSRWLRFPQVAAERWSQGNLVGIGDAVHTAHFSVGSGTTMALEDARELVAQLTSDRHPDLAAALAAFERTRRPIVSAVQDAAWASRRIWENPLPSPDLDTLLVRMLSRTGQLSLRQACRLDRTLSERLAVPANGLPELPVPTVHPWNPELPAEQLVLSEEQWSSQPADQLVLSEEQWSSQPAEQLVLSEEQWSSQPADRLPVSAGTLLLEAPAELNTPDGPAEGCERRLRELADLRPELKLGLLVRAGRIADEDLPERAGRIAELAKSSGTRLIVVAPGPADPAENRIAQLVLTEAVRIAADWVSVVYLCRPEELEYGWTHVRAGRADEVWTQGVAGDG
ncbi:MAG: FAD-dependent monooxygenase [Actinomycetota bacterium]|nr:FAD-dependent monooxygenase [Actinomycetota bacterium]